jgi:hypothetical protein
VLSRILFPQLPADGGPLHIFPEDYERPATPTTAEEFNALMEQQQEFVGQVSVIPVSTSALHVLLAMAGANLHPFALVGISVVIKCCFFFVFFFYVCREIVTAPSLLYPILLPKIYPPLFDLYALYCDREDDRYWERATKLNRQGDMALMAFLGIDQWVHKFSIKRHNFQQKYVVSIKGTLFSIKETTFNQLMQWSTMGSKVRYQGKQRTLICNLFALFKEEKDTPCLLLLVVGQPTLKCVEGSAALWGSSLGRYGKPILTLQFIYY